MELRWDNAYKDVTKFLEHNRCSTDNPASSNPLSLFLSPPSPFYYSYFLPFSSTEFLEKEKTRGAISGKTSLFLVGLWLLWFCDMDCSHRCWPCLLTNTDFFFFSLLFLAGRIKMFSLQSTAGISSYTTNSHLIRLLCSHPQLSPRVSMKQNIILPLEF